MRTIYKYKIPFKSASYFISEDSKILCVQEQDSEITMWVEENRDSETIPRTFVTYATGEELPDDKGTYIGTVQLGWTVWHVYEV